MFSHVMVGSNDLERSKSFYDRLFDKPGRAEQLGSGPGLDVCPYRAAGIGVHHHQRPAARLQVPGDFLRSGARCGRGPEILPGRLGRCPLPCRGIRFAWRPGKGPGPFPVDGPGKVAHRVVGHPVKVCRDSGGLADADEFHGDVELPHDREDDTALRGSVELRDHRPGQPLPTGAGSLFSVTPVYPERGNYRMPDYHRLDLGIVYQLRPRRGSNAFACVSEKPRGAPRNSASLRSAFRESAKQIVSSRAAKSLGDLRERVKTPIFVDHIQG